MIVAFTGHRPGKLNEAYAGVRLGPVIDAKLRDLRPEKAISGMALGLDQIAAQTCLASLFYGTKTHLFMPLVAAVPFKGQENRWPAETQHVYRCLLDLASEVVYVSSAPAFGATHQVIAAKMQRRNQWMVDRCDLLLSFWDGSPGGTGNCVSYAKRVGRLTQNFSPKTHKWETL